jgi:predicted membrane channel-forming protein YqfA (hemolysin III family)
MLFLRQSGRFFASTLFLHVTWGGAEHHLLECAHILNRKTALGGVVVVVVAWAGIVWRIMCIVYDIISAARYYRARRSHSFRHLVVVVAAAAPVHSRM